MLNLSSGGVVDDSESFAAFCDQRVAVREERQAERMRETPGHDHDTKAMLLGRVEYVRSRSDSHRGDADLRLVLLREQRGRRRYA
jgi:hypothetical protein